MAEEWQRGKYEISTDPTRIDLDAVYGFLSTEAYWALGVPREIVQRAIRGSITFGVYNGGEQVGFARVVSDRATFAWIADVFIVGSARGNGLSIWLMECIAAHPDLQGLRRWMLATRDAHGLYKTVSYTHLTLPTTPYV